MGRTSRERRAPSLVALAIVAIPSLAYAQQPVDVAAPRAATVGFRPGLTEGTGITPHGRLVVEVGASLDNSGAVPTHGMHAGEVVLHVPLAWRAELRLGLPSYAWHTSADVPTRRGMEQGGATLAMRLADGAGHPRWTSPIIALALGTSIPVTSGPDIDPAWLPVGKLLVEVPASSTVTLMANAGVRSTGARGDHRTGEFATGWVHRRLGSRAGAYAETLVASAPDVSSRAQVSAHTGVTYLLDTDHHLDVHAGRMLRGGRAEFAGVGLTSRF